MTSETACREIKTLAGGAVGGGGGRYEVLVHVVSSDELSNASHQDSV